MNEKMFEFLQQLATKLGTTSEHLWGVLIKQALVVAVRDIIELVITAALLTLLWKQKDKIFSWAKGYDSRTALIVFGELFIMVWLLICIYSFETVITAIFNPEYWAFDTLLSFFKSIK
jgi:hypothetical protein